MKRIIAMSSAALLGASLLASPALAQVSGDTGVGVGAGVGGAGVGVGGGAGSGGAISGSTDGAGSLNGSAGDVNIDANAQTDLNADVDGDTTASLGTTFQGALTALDENENSATSIGSMSEVSTVNVIRISELDGADMDAFTTAETDNSDSIGTLQSSISGNAAVMAALEAQSVDPSSVVAADVAADGSLTVYVR